MSRHNSRRHHNGGRSNRRGRGRGGRRNHKKTINPQHYINHDVVPNRQKTYEPTNDFVGLGLQEAIVNNLKAAGITHPTAIQDQAIGPIISGKDVIGLANTGTGKTAAFVLPLIERVSRNIQRNHTLIITPTRELATQIHDEFKTFSYGSNLKAAVCVGGLSIGRQINDLQRGANFIIGTPGRLKDLAQRRKLDLRKLQTIVLDEADQMLDMGFLPDMKHLIGLAPNQRQMLLFSATSNRKTIQLANEIMHDPVTVSVLAEKTSKHIHQDVIKVNDKSQKFDHLLSLISDDAYEKVLVFGETKYGVQRVSDNLTKRGFHSEAIHGNKNQNQRQRALDSFKSNKARVLVATDVAARGLDVPNVDLVVNFDEPNDHDTYIHRIGRTGRAGKSGTARTFVH